MNASAPEIAGLVPHAGDMMLLERVVSWDAARIRCTATGHGAATHPLRCGDRLPALAGIEYAAQAIAAHGALRRAGEPRPVAGVLAGLREVTLFVDRLDGAAGPLTIDAAIVAADGGNAIYAFRVDDVRGLLVEGRAAVATMPAPAPAT